jgi:predicted unusual protein kinase regulating ubiquinone biosynthesis (AarF/ABC1/UbiB family)
MEWVEGYPLTYFEEADESTRNHLAKTLFMAWYTPLYTAGLLHGDPHLGNYTATPDGQKINLLDFGCVRIFEPSFVEGILILYDALKHKNQKKAAEAYELWGFQNLSFELIETLNLWATYLYDPLLDDQVRFIHPELNSQEGQRLAKVIHEKLKALGGATPPRTFVFMDRVAVGLGSVFLRLKAKLNWHDLFQELTQNFQKDRFLEHQKKALA